MVIYYLTLVGLSPSSSWPLNDPLCEVFFKDNDAEWLAEAHWDTQRTVCIIWWYGLRVTGPLPALIRGRAQRLTVDADSPDSSGHCEGQLLGRLWG